ncbi:MAG: helix-turn-helix domain-containing protein [Lachnospiraceae bacterium]|nr:helix-turn-helix domain-containing protein [Lachnospiraceae bacterium]
MVDMNTVIASNISEQLKKQNKKQTELAEGIGVTKQVVNKILNGSRMVNAVELHRIADYFHVSMEELVAVHDKEQDGNVIRAFMGQVETDAAREALAVADELADMVLFHARVRENSEAMMQTWEI